MYTTSSNRDQVGVGDIKDLPGEVTSEHNKPFIFLYLGLLQLRIDFRIKVQKFLESIENTRLIRVHVILLVILTDCWRYKVPNREN